MIKQLQFAAEVLQDHPRLLQLPWLVGRRNLTNLVDYNFLRGRSFPPKAVTFRISGQCNLNCQMCIYRNSGYLDSVKMLPFPIYKEVIDEVHRYGLLIVFTGGEPLLHPQIIDCIAYAKERKLICSLTTNGWNLAERAGEIAESGLDVLTVSLDGPHEVHDNIRGRKESYRRALEGIKQLAGYEKHPLIAINTSIQSDNYAQIHELVSDTAGDEISAMNIQVLWTRPPERTARHNKRFPEFQVRSGWADESLQEIDFNILEEVLQKSTQGSRLVNVFPTRSIEKIETWYRDPEELLDGHRPKCPWMMANVFHDGTMRMCDDIIIGDLHQESFWEIWNGERMIRFRNELKASKNFSICAGCCSMFRDHII